MDYNFSQLNDKEFEILVADILTEHLGTTVERFKPGKDGGVDGRFFSTSGKEVIVQVKHRQNYKKMIADLKKTELPKVQKLNPASYIFVTSLPLSKGNKKEISAIFHPYIKSEIHGVLGRERLNGILSIFPKIEERHFKLWISSSNVLSTFLNKAITGRGGFEFKRMLKASENYVETTNHEQALGILEKNGVLIITGEPGVGKTTLADNLSLRLIEQRKYSLVPIEESISEAESVYKEGERQLFYYDDFLGSNYLEAIAGKKDSHIVNFIERIKEDRTKLFILTSRTNLLNQGIHWSPTFSAKNIQKNEFLLEIRKLSDLDKGRILYNHIWKSGLPPEYIEKIYENKRYLEIIKHKNFNPRLIEYITDVDRAPDDENEYWNWVKSMLNHPKEIWADCFRKQNDAFVRNLVLLVVFNGGSITEKLLKTSFAKLKKIDDELRPNSHEERDFVGLAKLATKSFLNRNAANSVIATDTLFGQIISRLSEPTYSLFNPSIADFVFHEYANEVEKMVSVQLALESAKSVGVLGDLKRNKLIGSDEFEKILTSLLAVANSGDLGDANYLLSIIWESRHDERRNGVIKPFLLKIIEHIDLVDAKIQSAEEFMILLREFFLPEELCDFSFLTSFLEVNELSAEAINEAASFIKDFGVNTEDLDISHALSEQANRIISGGLANGLYKVELEEAVTNIAYDSNGDIYYDVQEDVITEQLYDIAKEIEGTFSSEALNLIKLDTDGIIGNISLDDEIRDFAKEQLRDQGPDEREGMEGLRDDRAMAQEIEDLFERT